VLLDTDAATYGGSGHEKVLHDMQALCGAPTVATLALTEKQTGGAANVAYLQSDLLSLKTGRTYDVIFCAEMLMYIREKDGAEACRILDTCLKPGGIIIEVSQQDREAGRPKFFHGWDKILGAYFEIAHRERFDDPERPYEIVGYRRRTG
jgi:hypothetical protein